MTWVARKVNQALVVQGPDEELYPPGGGAAKRWVQRDRVEVSIVSHGDAFDLYIGQRKKTGMNVYNVTMEPRTAVSLAFWLLWWWVWKTWFGLKLKMWHWSLGKLVRSSNG